MQVENYEENHPRQYDRAELHVLHRRELTNYNHLIDRADNDLVADACSAIQADYATMREKDTRSCTTVSPHTSAYSTEDVYEEEVDRLYAAVARPHNQPLPQIQPRRNTKATTSIVSKRIMRSGAATALSRRTAQSVGSAKNSSRSRDSETTSVAQSISRSYRTGYSHTQSVSPSGKSSTYVNSTYMRPRPNAAVLANVTLVRPPTALPPLPPLSTSPPTFKASAEVQSRSPGARNTATLMAALEHAVDRQSGSVDDATTQPAGRAAATIGLPSRASGEALACGTPTAAPVQAAAVSPLAPISPTSHVSAGRLISTPVSAASGPPSRTSNHPGIGENEQQCSSAAGAAQQASQAANEQSDPHGGDTPQVAKVSLDSPDALSRHGSQTNDPQAQNGLQAVTRRASGAKGSARPISQSSDPRTRVQAQSNSLPLPQGTGSPSASPEPGSPREGDIPQQTLAEMRGRAQSASMSRNPRARNSDKAEDFRTRTSSVGQSARQSERFKLLKSQRGGRRESLNVGTSATEAASAGAASVPAVKPAVQKQHSYVLLMGANNTVISAYDDNVVPRNSIVPTLAQREALARMSQRKLSSPEASPKPHGDHSMSFEGSMSGPGIMLSELIPGGSTVVDSEPILEVLEVANDHCPVQSTASGASGAAVTEAAYHASLPPPDHTLETMALLHSSVSHTPASSARESVAMMTTQLPEGSMRSSVALSMHMLPGSARASMAISNYVGIDSNRASFAACSTRASMAQMPAGSVRNSFALAQVLRGELRLSSTSSDEPQSAQATTGNAPYVVPTLLAESMKPQFAEDSEQDEDQDDLGGPDDTLASEVSETEPFKGSTGRQKRVSEAAISLDWDASYMSEALPNPADANTMAHRVRIPSSMQRHFTHSPGQIIKAGLHNSVDLQSEQEHMSPLTLLRQHSGMSRVTVAGSTLPTRSFSEQMHPHMGHATRAGQRRSSLKETLTLYPYKSEGVQQQLAEPEQGASTIVEIEDS
jgi:hypothetical protein